MMGKNDSTTITVNISHLLSPREGGFKR